MPDNLVINGHGHVLPDPGDIPAFMREREIFWIDRDRKFMYQKNWRRPITDQSFFVDKKLEWMNENGIDHGVMITLSQLYCNGYALRDASDVTRFQNDFHGQLQKENPDRFTAGFVVPLMDIDTALKEIERCLDDLGLSFLCLPTHYVRSDGQWESTASDHLRPIYEYADERKLAIEVHPYDAPKIIHLKDEAWRFHLVWMPAQTADFYHFFTLKNFAEEYPNIRTCLAHGNVMGQVNIGRRTQGFNGRPDLFSGMHSPKNSIAHKNIFFDTLTHDADVLELIIKKHGTSQIVFGLDDPYPLGEMGGIEDSYPGKVLDDLVKGKSITEEERKRIKGENVLRWLYGEEPTHFFNRIKQANDGV